MSEEKVLATVEAISGVTKHPNADSLYFLQIQNWKVIVNLRAMFGDASPESLVGRKVVYIQTDSIMPKTFENEDFWPHLAGKRVKTIKLRGQFSQGLVIDFESLKPLFPDLAPRLDSLPAETNLTNELGITKYYSPNDPENPACTPMQKELSNCLATFPNFLRKTDQPRLQAKKDIIAELEGRLFTATQKYDGQSVQWYCCNGQTGVCSRNYRVLLEEEVINKNFHSMNRKYEILRKLEEWCGENKRNISVQTEMYGVGINGNRHKKTDIDLVVFDVYDINAVSFLPHDEVVQIAGWLNLPRIPVVFEKQVLPSTEIDYWLKLANSQRYSGGLLAEGIVVKTADGKDPYVSFKVISQEYCLKHDL